MVTSLSVMVSFFEAGKGSGESLHAQERRAAKVSRRWNHTSLSRGYRCRRPEKRANKPAMAEASVYTILATLAAVVRCTSMNLPRVGVYPLDDPLSECRPGLYARNETRC